MITLFHDLLRQRAEDRGADPAFVFIDRDDRERLLTFEALDRQARQVAALLAEARIAPGERVLLLFPPGLDFVPAFYGSMIAGTVSIAAYPPDPRLGAAALASLLSIAADAKATAVIAPRFVCHALAGKMAGRLPAPAACGTRSARLRARRCSRAPPRAPPPIRAAA